MAKVLRRKRGTFRMQKLNPRMVAKARATAKANGGDDPDDDKGKQNDADDMEIVEGTGSAKIATLNVRDHHGDVIMNGAFGNAEVLLSSWNHDISDFWVNTYLPVGAGDLREDGDDVILDFTFLLKTQRGKETYDTLRALEEIGKLHLVEWSWTGYIVDAKAAVEDEENVWYISKIEAFEASPVVQGAGIDTGETELAQYDILKAAKAILEAHKKANPDPEPEGGQAQGEGNDPAKVAARPNPNPFGVTVAELDQQIAKLSCDLVEADL